MGIQNYDGGGAKDIVKTASHPYKFIARWDFEDKLKRNPKEAMSQGT